MIYNKKEKKKIIKSLLSLVNRSNKIKAITKTRFLNELGGERERERKNSLYLKSILDHILSDLEGKDADHLKEHLKKKVGDILYYIDKSEEEIIKNTLKKVKNTSLIITNKKTPLILHLLQISRKKKIKIIIHKDNKKINFEHIDLALINIDKIDSNTNILTNKNSRSLIEKANKADIPVYCYIHSWDIIPKIKNKKIIKPSLVKSIISELGIFEPEIFVQELKLNYPWLLK